MFNKHKGLRVEVNTYIKRFQCTSRIVTFQYLYQQFRGIKILDKTVYASTAARKRS